MKFPIFAKEFMRRKRTFVFVFATLFLIFSSVGSAQADPPAPKSILWQGHTDSDWNTAGNWVWDGGVPTSIDTANIGSVAPGDSAPVIGAGTSGTAGLLVVGGGGTGGLTVHGGLTTSSAQIGNDNSTHAHDFIGTVTVAGTGATWANTGDLYVGFYSTGNLNIADHAQVTTSKLIIGAVNDPLSTAPLSGTVTLSDTGSNLTLTSGLSVGENTTGTLNIGSGTTVTGVGAVIGNGTTGNGTVNLTGAGASLAMTDYIHVGYNGTGTLNVGSGATVTSVGAYLGNSAGAVGTATIDGGSWNTGAGTILIGGYGQGDLTIKNGGTLTSTGGTIAWGANGGTSTATVTGAGSKWTSSGGLYVGNNGTGVLNIQAGGAVSTAQAFVIGANNGSNGTVELTGTGSKLTADDRLDVGYQGTGRLTVNAGTTVTANALYIGSSDNGHGTVTVSGTGAKLTATHGGFVGYGTGSTGSLTVENGASLETVSGDIRLKSGSTLNVTGAGTTVDIGTAKSGVPSTWSDSDGWLYLGNSTVNVSAGAHVTTDGLYVSGDTTGAASMTVTGPGTVLDGKLCIYVGGDGNDSGTTGNGTLTLSGGATGSASVIAAGNDPGTTGTILLTGAGTSLSSVYNTGTFTGKVYAGYEGTGVITVQNGASLSAAGELRVGWASGSVGTVNIESGATVTSHGTIIGNEAGATGTVAVTGAGTTWTDSGENLVVGRAGTGTLTISDGAMVSASHLYAAAEAGSTGSITLSGADAKLQVQYTADVGLMTGGVLVSDGSLTVENGAAFETVAGALTVAGTGLITGTGTSLKTGTLHPGTPANWGDADGWFFINGAVTVSDHATVEADGVNVYGGNSRNATMTVTGPGTTMDAHLLIYVGGDGNDRGGDGVLTISDGATASASVIATGVDAGATGTILLTGAGTSLSSVYNNEAFTGKVYIGYLGNGIITVQNGASLSAADVIRVAWESGSTGTLNIGAAEGQAAMAAGTVTAANGLVFGDGTGTVVFNHTDTNYSFAPSMSGNGTVKVLSGTTVFTGANTYSGDTIITQGTLRAGAAGAFSANSAVTVNSTGTLDLNNSDQAIGGLAGSGTVTLGSGILTINDTGNSEFSGSISGTGGLTKAGTGTLTLSGTNSYSGATTINGGTLRAGAVNVFSANSIVTVNANGTLDLNNYDQTIVDLSGNGRVLLGTATLTLTNNTTTNAFTLSGTGGVTKTGSGTLTLSGTGSDYSGETAVTAGILQAGATNAFSPNSVVAVSANGTLDLNSYSQTVGGLSGSGAVTLGSATLTVATTADNTFSGSISGSGGVTKTGTGTLALTGDNGYTGATVVQQGTLSLAGSSASSAMTVSSGATLDFNPSRDLAYNGVISGSGAVTKTGSNTLTLTGDNTYTGATVIQQGTLSLTGSSASSSMAVSSGATLDFNPSRDLAYNGVISGSGAVTKTGSNTLTLTGTNAYTGGTSIAGGTIAISSDANLGASTGALTLAGGTLQTTAAISTARDITVNGSGTINNTGNDVTLSGKLLGAGDLTLAGSGTDTLDAAFNGSGYTGTLTRSAGTLNLVSGSSLSGTLAVSDGATLNGVGTVNNLTVNGSIAPGNSPGTITVSGNYVQGASGVYVCQVSPTANDLIAVTGSATLGGTLSIVPEYTYYNSGTVWSVLTATGGVSGTYDTVTYGATPENWIFVPVYSANAVTVTLARQSYSNSATSSQASSVGSSLDAVAYNATGEMATLIKSLDYSYGTNSLYSAGNALTDYALNVLSPEVYSAFTQNVFETSRMLTGAQRAGLHEGEGSAGQGYASPLDFGPASLAAQNTQDGGIPGASLGSSAQTLSLGRLGIFLKPLGMRATQQGSSEQTGYVSLAGGITGGMLYRPSPELTLGLAPGFVSQSVTLHNEGGGQGTINDWSLGLLAAYRHGSFYADAGIRGAYNNFRSSRSLPLPAAKYTAKANWDGWNTNVSVGGGYDFTAGDFTYGPLASVSWQRLHENGFTETGAGTLGQSIRARNTNALNTTLGAHVSRTFETSVGDVTPELRAAWSAQWLDDSQNIVATFIGSPTSTYQAKTKNQRYNSALVDMGMTVGVSRSLAATARVGVELFRPGYAAQAASVGLKYSF